MPARVRALDSASQRDVAAMTDACLTQASLAFELKTSSEVEKADYASETT